MCRLWVARSSAGSRLPGRHFSVAASRCAACLVFLWVAVPREGRHLGALKVVFCPQAHAGHFGRLVGTATPLRGHRRPGPVRASAHLSRVLVGARVTPAVHSHGPAPLAPVVAGDCKGAHGRVNSDRAVDCPCCEADQTSKFASPRGSLARLSSQVSRRTVRLVLSHAVDSKQHGRSVPAPWWFGQGHAGKYVPNAGQSKRAAHTPHTGPACVLLYCPLTC